MTRGPGLVPTLTEVIELALDPQPLDVATPPAPESVALDEAQLARIVDRLRPQLDAWVEARVRNALLALAPQWAESAARAIGHELEAALPGLVAQALRDSELTSAGSARHP